MISILKTLDAIVVALSGSALRFIQTIVTSKDEFTVASVVDICIPFLPELTVT